MIPPLAADTTHVGGSDALGRQAEVRPSRDPPVIALHQKAACAITTPGDHAQESPSTQGTAVIETSDDIMKALLRDSRTQREEFRSLHDIRRKFLCFELGRAEIESGEDGLGFGAEGLEDRVPWEIDFPGVIFETRR